MSHLILGQVGSIQFLGEMLLQVFDPKAFALIMKLSLNPKLPG